MIFEEFDKALRKAREKTKEAQLAEQVVFEILGSIEIDTEEIETLAENADNLHQAISCYINYGEYTIEGIMEELKNAYESI